MNVKELKELIARAEREIQAPPETGPYTKQYQKWLNDGKPESVEVHELYSYRPTRQYYSGPRSQEEVDEKNKEWAAGQEFSWRDFVDNEFSFYSRDWVTQWFADQGIEIGIVDQYGGEGQGDEYWIVFEVEHDGVKTQFQLDGWYASYHGHEFDDYYAFYEVEEAEKTVTYWKAKDA